MRLILVVTLLIVFVFESVATAKVPKGRIFGWVNAEYGVGSSRYPDNQGGDRLGAQQLAIGVLFKNKNFKFVGVMGADALSVGGEGTAGLQDAFVVWDKINKSNFSFSIGAQPFLFGLKPNGYPGDRSLLPSLEFAMLNKFEIARQRGPSAILGYSVPKVFKFRLGGFDTGENNDTVNNEGVTVAGDKGSSLGSNIFAQLDTEKFAGIRFTLGWENRFIGVIGESKPITTIGALYELGKFDVSVELISLAKEHAGTTDDEQISVFEITLRPKKYLTSYLDYSSAAELERQTVRAGLKVDLNESYSIQLEYARDEFTITDTTAESGEIRFRYQY